MVAVALSVGTAVIRFYKTPPIFVSQGSMWETEKLRLPDGASFTYDRDNYIGTLTELLRSRKMWERTTAYMEAYRTNQIIRDQNGNVIPVEIQVFASPKSSVYTIEARCSNPAFAPAYLNALMEQYREYRLNVRGEVSLHTQSSISEQVQEYERDMKKAQAALSEYEQSNNFAVLQQESSIDATYLAKLKTDLSDYQLQFKLLAARELEAASGGAAGSPSSASAMSSPGDSGFAARSTNDRLDASRQVELLKLERERLAKNLRPTHPKMVKLDEEITRAQKLIEVYGQQNREQVEAAREALQMRIDEVGRFIKLWEAKVADENKRLAKADGLKQEVLSKLRMYDRLTALNDNVEVSQHIDQDTLEILDEASPAKRSYVEAKSNLSQSVIIGLALGLGVVLLLCLRDDRFGSLVEVTETFGDNIVGQVPEMPRIAGGELAPLVNNDDRHGYAESYRNLRSALLYLAVEGRRPKVLLITSAVPDEGKSTVATNLARALALGGSKVLLIDGDLRKGHIHQLLQLQSAPGLSELLRLGEDPQKFIQTTDLSDFAFLSRGSATRNPGDLFLSPIFDQIIAQLREQFDYVLIDSSPVFAADDTATLAPKVDGTLFVVRSRFSHARVVCEALDLLFQRQAMVLGLILNRSNSASRSYYFYKYEKYYSGTNCVEVDAGS